MAFKHFAFTFDSISAHKELYEKVVEHGIVYPLRLLKLAQDIMQQPSQEAQIILSTFRYGESWLIDAENDQSNSYLWYIIYISTFLKEAPSLSNNRISGSHFVLEKILPLAGWTKSEVRSLLFGKPVESLMDATDFSLLSHNLNLDSGCLGIKDLSNLKSKLVDTFDTFILDIEYAKPLQDIIGNSKLTLEQLVEYAFKDGIDMLSATEKHGDAIYLFRD